MRWIEKVLLIVFFITVFVSPLAAGSLDLIDVGGSLTREIGIREISGEILVDIYDFFSSLDYRINWSSRAERMEVKNGERSYNFHSGTHRVLVGGNRLFDLSPPFFDNQRLYLPVDSITRLINQTTEEKLVWNSSRRQLQFVEAEVDRSADEYEQLHEDPVRRYLEEEMAASEEREWLVVIDPGHGGRDPGAIGPTGLMEKEVVLNISLKLAEKIESRYPNIRTFLTLDKDEFIPLHNRTRMANELEADLFISIHANGHHSPHPTGFEMFILSGEATDPSAEQLAATENSVLKQYEGYQQQELDGLVWILHQLRGMVHTRESEALAKLIGETMEQRSSTPNRGIKGAPLWVLKDAQMPAVLVETGFLSNPREEERLRTPAYQQELADAIARAVYRYWERYY